MNTGHLQRVCDNCGQQDDERNMYFHTGTKEYHCYGCRCELTAARQMPMVFSLFPLRMLESQMGVHVEQTGGWIMALQKDYGNGDYGSYTEESEDTFLVYRHNEDNLYDARLIYEGGSVVLAMRALKTGESPFPAGTQFNVRVELTDDEWNNVLFIFDIEFDGMALEDEVLVRHTELEPYDATQRRTGSMHDAWLADIDEMLDMAGWRRVSDLSEGTNDYTDVITVERKASK